MEQNNTEYRLLKVTRAKGELSEAKPRCKKLKPRIDLAAMISVSFLLIIFFMVTKEMSRPQSMDFGVRRGGCGPDYGGCMDHRRQMTLLLGDNDKIIGYRGILESPDEKPKVFAYGKNGIRKELLRISKQVPMITGFKDYGAIVIIKPSKKSNYGNLVDILDEMSITNIRTYAIINDYTPEEVKLLASR